jgi:hypothetical protein
MRCEKCGQDFPSPLYFKENTARPICSSCFATLPPEEQQALLAKTPALPENRPSPFPWRRVTAIAILVVVACVIGYFLFPLL